MRQENLDACSQDAAATAAEMSKQAAIMAAELAKRSNVSSSSPGWLTSILVNKIIKSFQVRVHDVHIRVEVDAVVSGGPGAAIGLVCHSMCSRTQHSAAGQQMLEVRGLCMYWDRDMDMTCLGDAPLAEVAALFDTWGCAEKAESLPSVHEDDDGDIFYVAPSDDGSSSTVQHHWVLQACDVDMSGSLLSHDKSQFNLLLTIHSIPLVLEVGQIWDMFRLLDWFQVVGIRKQHVHLRPREGVAEDTRGWWRYAVNATLQRLKARRWRLTWADLRVHLGQRREYSQLYRLVLKNKVCAQDRVQLAYLESQLPVEAIMFARGVAELDEVGLSGSSSASSIHGKEAGSRAAGGWFRWGLRWMAQSKSDAPRAGQHQSGDPCAGVAAHEDQDSSDSGEENLHVSLTQEQEDFLYRLSHPSSNVSNVSNVTTPTNVPDDSEPESPASPPFEILTPRSLSDAAPAGSNRSRRAVLSARGGASRSASSVSKDCEHSRLASSAAAPPPTAGTEREREGGGSHDHAMCNLASSSFGGRAHDGEQQTDAQVEIVVQEVRVTLAVLISDDYNNDKASPPLGAQQSDLDGAPYVGIQEILTATLTGVHASSMRGDELLVKVGVEAIKVRDLITAHTCHPWLLISRPRSQLASMARGGDWYMPDDMPDEIPDDLQDSANPSPAACSNHLPEHATQPCTHTSATSDVASEDTGQMALTLEMCVKAEGHRSKEARSSMRITLNPLEARLAPETLQALASYFVPEFEYPFHEHLVLDALNSIEQGRGLLAAKLAYMVERSASGFLSLSVLFLCCCTVCRFELGSSACRH